MNSREPTLVSHTHYCVVGDVTIDNSAAIAPGVVLQASPGSRIVIGKGVCLAAGVCLQSRSGVLTVADGASLGANVLLVGNGMVGTNACVSASSTLINPQVGPNDILPPNTLVNGPGNEPVNGSKSNSVALAANGRAQMNGFVYAATTAAATSSATGQASSFVPPRPVVPRAVEIPAIGNGYSPYVDPSSTRPNYGTPNNDVQLERSYSTHNNSGASSSPAPTGAADATASAANGSSSLSVRSYDRVYGRDQVNQLISALFPGRQSFNEQSLHGQSLHGQSNNAPSK